MKIHYFQHVPFEGLGYIGTWLWENGAAVSSTRFFESAELPKPEEVDGLIVMGGPMSVNDTYAHPWLEPETRFIADTIALGKPVLGICLGAQLIAKAAGARVYKNPVSEIGWFPVTWLQTSVPGMPEVKFPTQMDVFQWHGETFDLPKDAIHLAASEACAHQAFLLKERVLGLQFHLEIMSEGVQALVGACGSELTEGRYIQTPGELIRRHQDFRQTHLLMERILITYQFLITS